MRSINGLDYRNTGDWVESRTALVEELDGTLRLLQFTPTGDVLRILAVYENKTAAPTNIEPQQVLEAVA